MNLKVTGGLLIDGTGAEPVSNATIVVEGDTIVAAGPDAPPSGGSVEQRVIEAGGKTILPGLVECHVHLGWARTGGNWADLVSQDTTMHVARAIRNGIYALSQGITMVRECGSKDGMSINLRNAINAGIIVGPRIVASGLPITITGGHACQYAREADGPDEVRKATRASLKAGADFIKLMGNGGFTVPHGDDVMTEQLNRAELTAAVQEAHNARKRVAVHASGKPIANAIAAGADTIEHAVFLEPDDARAMAERGMFLIPTLLSMQTMAHRSSQWRRSETVGRSAAHALEHHKRSFRLAVESGIRVATGTDFVLDVVSEMELMVRYGLTPMQAIVAATSNAAEALGRSATLGTIAPGKLADFIIVDGNPLSDVGELRRVELVIKDGVVYDPRALKATVAQEWA